jgi:hypothetical protein
MQKRHGWYLGSQLDVATAAVQGLLVLHGVLKHKGLSLVVEVRGLGRDVVPAVVCGCLNTCNGQDVA